MNTDTPKRGPGQPVKDGKPAGKFLHIRITGERKGAYKRAAYPRPMAEWMFEHLDRAAGYESAK